ncbi:hypothetical protein GCM10010435_50660 [Winogradskya consettensis]|uniref:Uncharacterized protein n=1 Tax=Winogradskya consettensis TaxID=113560 RepID=A0A919VMW6_9ACTN|nr:hypothetical protein Aco04nite_28770 [Actinoplanes consettensis]
MVKAKPDFLPSGPEFEAWQQSLFDLRDGGLGLGVCALVGFQRGELAGARICPVLRLPSRRRSVGSARLETGRRAGLRTGWPGFLEREGLGKSGNGSTGA